MKKLFVLLLVICCISQFHLLAQTNNPDKSINATNDINTPKDSVDNDFFIGTWKYENKETNEVFIMKTMMHSYYNPCFEKTFTDLVGAYKYEKNGEIVIDCLDELKKDQRNYKYPIQFSAEKNENNVRDRLFYITDYKTRNKKGEYKSLHSIFNKITVISSTEKKQIKFELYPDKIDDYYLWKTEEEVFPRGTVLPCDMILTKEPDEIEIIPYNGFNNGSNNGKIAFPKP